MSLEMFIGFLAGALATAAAAVLAIPHLERRAFEQGKLLGRAIERKLLCSAIERKLWEGMIR